MPPTLTWKVTGLITYKSGETTPFQMTLEERTIEQAEEFVHTTVDGFYRKRLIQGCAMQAVATDAGWNCLINYDRSKT